MKKPMVGCVVVWLLTGPLGATQDTVPHAATPDDPIATIVEAFRTHDVVTLTDPHGNTQVQTVLLSLVLDPRFAEVANDVVIETASARYQDAIDRFVRGDDVELGVLRKAWEEWRTASEPKLKR
jgi:hypothetical protein